MPNPNDGMPAPVERSDKKARDTWKLTHDTAAEQYGDGERAYRTAYAALKHTHEKVGDHWEPKDQPGASDAQSKQSGADARDHPRMTYGGVDVVGKTKDELLAQASQVGASVSTAMTKPEVAEAIDKANRKANAKARASD